MPPALWGTACLLHWLPEGGEQASVQFLLRSTHGERFSAEEWTGRLQAASHSTPHDERLRRTTAPGSPSERRSLQRAKVWLQDSGLHDWLHHLNTAKKVAPVSALVLGERDRRGGAADLRPPQAPKQKHRLQWLRRWRGRWQVRLGRVLGADRPEPDACVRKDKGSPELREVVFLQSVSRAHRRLSGRRDAPSFATPGEAAGANRGATWRPRKEALVISVQ